MKTVGLIFLWLATMVASAQTNQSWPVCRNPVRTFGTHVVNLEPLFQWWKRQAVPTNAAGYTSASIDIDTNTPDDGERPLAAWHRVTGTLTGTTTTGSWVLQAVIYTSPSCRTNARIILNRPPTAEEQYYFTLKAELDQATLLITNAGRAYQDDLKAEKKDRQYADAYRRSGSKVGPDSAINFERDAAQLQEAANTALNQQHQLEAQRNLIEAQFKAIPAMDGAYYVDWFAVMVGRTKQGVPIYDMGLVSPTPL